MINPADYTITVKRVIADGEPVFRASVRELPHLAEYADSYTEAYELVLDAIQTLYEAAKESERDFPIPSSDESDFSGRVTLRMPKSLHRQMSDQAVAEGISFNQYLVSVLSYAAAHGASYFSLETTLADTSLSGLEYLGPSEIGKQSVRFQHTDISRIVMPTSEDQTVFSGNQVFVRRMIDLGEQDSGSLYEGFNTRSHQ